MLSISLDVGQGVNNLAARIFFISVFLHLFHLFFNGIGLRESAFLLMRGPLRKSLEASLTTSHRMEMTSVRFH